LSGEFVAGETENVHIQNPAKEEKNGQASLAGRETRPGGPCSTPWEHHSMDGK
jgi:hypothetical protein